MRGTFENDRLTNVQQLFESVSTGRGHFGGKIAFDGKGYLFLTLGDRQVPPEGNLEAHPAQDLTNHHGKLIRLHDDGKVPADNPFVNRAGAKPEIWSYGHRNMQGIAIDPATGNVWTNEHGPQGGDELNLDRARAQLRLAGDRLRRELHHRQGDPLGHAPRGHGAAAAHLGAVDRHLGRDVLHRRPLPAAGRATSSSAAWSASRSDASRSPASKVLARETLLPGVGRVRDIRQGPDGFIYLVTEDEDGKPTPVVRLEPVDRSTSR